MKHKKLLQEDMARKGDKAVKKRFIDHREVAKKGGLEVLRKYGREHYVKMGKKGRSVAPKSL